MFNCLEISFCFYFSFVWLIPLFWLFLHFMTVSFPPFYLLISHSSHENDFIRKIIENIWSFPFISFISFWFTNLNIWLISHFPFFSFLSFFLGRNECKTMSDLLWIFPLYFIVTHNDEREMWYSLYFVSFSFSSMIFPMSCIEERNTCCHPHFSLSVFWFVNSLK